MVSNSLSSRRGIIRRPKVCKSIPKWKLITSGSFPACSLEPTEQTISEANYADLEFFACLLCEPKTIGINVTDDPDGGYFVYSADPENCVNLGMTWFPPAPGDFVVTLTAHWFTGATCSASATIHVVPL
jgi:hypothetical protein